MARETLGLERLYGCSPTGCQSSELTTHHPDSGCHVTLLIPARTHTPLPKPERSPDCCHRLLPKHRWNDFTPTQPMPRDGPANNPTSTTQAVMRAQTTDGSCLATQLDANPALTLRTLTSKAFRQSRRTGKRSVALHQDPQPLKSYQPYQLRKRSDTTSEKDR